MNKSEFRVSIIIPNWNGKSLLAKNLPAVIGACPKTQIIVTDDASDDGSVEFLKSSFPNITVIANKAQLGFAGNVNTAVAKTSGEIIVLLNTDVAPEKDFLSPLLAHFGDSVVAAVGCLEKSHEDSGIQLRGRGLARWEKGYFIHSRGEVDRSDTAWVSGGSGAFRKSIWQKLGGMDTLFNPFYWEDIDLSYRMLKSGYSIAFEPKSVVHHEHEKGAIKTRFNDKYVKRIVYRNQFIFLWKNMSDRRLWISHILWTPLRLVQSLFRGDIYMLQGYFLAMVQLPNILTRREMERRFWIKTDTQLFPSN